MEITSDFCGGNIKVLKQQDTEVLLERDMRDSSGSWFYWAFCVKGAAGKRVRFCFASSPRIGRFGPAVSHDLNTWVWLGDDGESCPDSFCYSFGKDEHQVWFAHHILYLPEYFFRFAHQNKLTVGTLCTTGQGRRLPYTIFGFGADTILLTARHHCCESTGSYVLEGVIEGFLEKKPPYKIIAVPFVDYDGVCNGDQGKNRIPHDHNRDYIQEPLYPVTKAIQALGETHNIRYVFDFHSPGHSGGRNEFAFLVRNTAGGELEQFAQILERNLREGSFPYHAENDILLGTEWNTGLNPTLGAWFLQRGARLSFTLETTYFGTEEDPVLPKKLRLLGRSFADAVCLFDNAAVRYENNPHQGISSSSCTR